MFIDPAIDLNNISVRRIAGNAVVAGIGIIEFTLKDIYGNSETLRYDNTIYFPEADRNIISIVQWSEDESNTCGALSRGDNKTSNRTDHPLSSRIPLMDVNEPNDRFTLFLSLYEHQLLDKDNILIDGE